MRKEAAPVPTTLAPLTLEGPLTEDQVVHKWTLHILEQCGGNKSLAARVLGIDRRSLYRRLGYGYPSDDRGSYAAQC